MIMMDVCIQDVCVRPLSDAGTGNDNQQVLKILQKFLKDPVVWLEYDASRSVKETLFSIFESASFEPELIWKSILDRNNGFRNFLTSIRQSDWCCAFTSTENVEQRKIFMVRFPLPVDFGCCAGIRLLIMIFEPKNSLSNAKQVAENFSVIMEHEPTRKRLLFSCDNSMFIKTLHDYLSIINNTDEKISENFYPEKLQCSFGRGIKENFQRRIRYYWSDFRDGFDSWRTVAKVSSATCSLFFACILPCVAFGVLDKHNTDGAIGPKEALLGQAIGGLVFALFAGQPLVIIATTAPLCLYTALVYRISLNLSVDFFDLFALVGIWNGVFLTLYALFDFSQLMNWCTRFTEEIFSTFIFFAFIFDAIRECVASFDTYYHFEPEKSILFLFLMIGTFLLGLALFNFSKTFYFTKFIRDTIADYSLPLAVIIFSVIGSIFFENIHPESFVVSNEYRWQMAELKSLNPASIGLSAILGFGLSVLFFIDQNVSAALVDAPENRLKKGGAYHWDLLLVGILNVFLSFLGFPWMHGILPHSPMHAKALADYDLLDDGDERIVIRSRETRITGILIHLLIGVVVIFLPQILTNIPVAVLCGLFLYCASMTLVGNSLFQRFCLFFVEPNRYPSVCCSKRIVHLYTGIQLILLIVICFFGFSPWEYVQLAFPFIIAILIPFRWFILSKIIDPKHLKTIDCKH